MFSPAVKVVANNLKLVLSTLQSGMSDTQASSAEFDKDCLVANKQP